MSVVDLKEPTGDSILSSDACLPYVPKLRDLDRRSSWPLLSSYHEAQAFALENTTATARRSRAESLDAYIERSKHKTCSARHIERCFSPATSIEGDSSIANSKDWPSTSCPTDAARILTPSQIRWQKSFFFGFILAMNIGCALAAIFADTGTFVFTFILFIKAKDFLSVFITIFGLLYRCIHNCFWPRPAITSQWILTLIPAYSESEEQIIKAIYSLRNNDVEPHRQVMCVVLDGKTRDIRSRMTKVIKAWERPYVTLRFKTGVLKLVAGFIEDVPVMVIEKVKNAGKKDSLVLCMDLFNAARSNLPLYTRLLREEIEQDVLPILTHGHAFNGFNMVFCTDADSTIHKGALLHLANTLVQDKDVIAACGVVLVELEPGYRWSVWNLYQQYQYTFGQFVRRQAEDIVGKVTCLPGCVTMIAVRPEMAGAMRKYAEPITAYPVLAHQVQYLGTDRRLTYSMLSQGRNLKTRFVPSAVSETVAPQSLKHYLSQRRRWGSNSYFNNFYYCFGEKMIVITRIAASMELLRLSMVYYRVFNTALFIKGLVESFVFIDVLPLLIVSQTPTIWFLFTIIALNHDLRSRSHKLFLGFFINKCIAPIMSIVVFTKVATNLGSQVWGMSGITATTATITPSRLEAQPVPVENFQERNI